MIRDDIGFDEVGEGMMTRVETRVLALWCWHH